MTVAVLGVVLWAGLKAALSAWSRLRRGERIPVLTLDATVEVVQPGPDGDPVATTHRVTADVWPTQRQS